MSNSLLNMLAYIPNAIMYMYLSCSKLCWHNWARETGWGWDSLWL